MLNINTCDFMELLSIFISLVGGLIFIQDYYFGRKTMPSVPNVPIICKLNLKKNVIDGNPGEKTCE